MKYTQEFNSAQKFMNNILLKNGKVKQSFIVVSHINSTSIPLIRTLAEHGRMVGIIPKPNSIDFKVYERISDLYPVLKLTKQDFKQPEIIKNRILPLLNTDEKLTIVDIGGYFAPALQELNQHPNFAGIIEDTENGLQKYEKALSEYPQNKIPIFSIARSRSKDFEDYLIGRSIAMATMAALKPICNPESLQIGIIGFGEVGRGTAFYLKDTLKLNPKIYDYDKKVENLIKKSGFSPASRADVINTSDVLICATGHGSLKDQDIPNLKKGVYIASCTSEDDEFAFQKFSITENSKTNEHITETQGINFLNQGNAVNFLHPAKMEQMLSPYIYLTHSALLQSVVCLNHRKGLSASQINTLLPQEERKLIHNFRQGIRKTNSNSIFINNLTKTKLTNCLK